MATATTQNDAARLLSASYSGTDEIRGTYTLRANHNARGVVFYCLATTDGTLDLYYVDLAGQEALLATQAVVADDLTVVDFDFIVRLSRARFTPDAADGTVYVDGYSYPIG